MSTEIVPRAQPLLPMDIDSAEQQMIQYQELTARLLKADDWQGLPGQRGAFVKRSGWAKISTFYGVSTEVLRYELDRDENDKLLRAHVTVRASAPNGRHADGDGGCSVDEPRFASRGGRQKVEHDLPATATTRATNRAISNLVGFGQVSAEEMSADGSPAALTADWIAPMSDTRMDETGDVLRDVLDRAGAQDPGDLAGRIGNALYAFCDDSFPACCDRLIRMLWQATTPTGPPVPDMDDGDAPDAAAPDVPPEEELQ